MTTDTAQDHRELRTRELGIGEARMLCYALGPFSALLMLNLRRWTSVQSVRYHAFHSLLMSAVWAAAWLALHLIEIGSPWFLGTLAKEGGMVVNLGFLMIWCCLLIAAYQGSRWVVVPVLDRWASRLAGRCTVAYRPRGSMRTA